MTRYKVWLCTRTTNRVAGEFEHDLKKRISMEVECEEQIEAQILGQGLVDTTTYHGYIVEEMPNLAIKYANPF